MDFPGRLISVNIAAAESVRTGSWSGKPGYTGIDKRPVAHRVRLLPDRVEGDTVADTRHHGGRDQAVYAYGTQDAAWWAQRLGRDVGPGAFGENLTVSGVPTTDAVIGQLWHVGSAVLEVCSPRIPCRVFAWFWDVPDLITQFTRAVRPGVYLRVLQPGDVGAGDAVEVGPPPGHGLTIGETFRALTGERSLAAKLLTAPQLPADAHASARTWLASAPG